MRCNFFIFWDNGLDIGLSKAGFNIAVGQGFDSACAVTMRANGHKVLGGDIREINEADLLEQAGLAQGEPFLICSGSPCQPFSTAGKRLGLNDPRGSLLMDFIRMLDDIRPCFFIMKKQPLRTGLDVIFFEFDKLGYKTVDEL